MRHTALKRRLLFKSQTVQKRFNAHRADLAVWNAMLAVGHFFSRSWKKKALAHH
ncbi:MAG TPA: hypothetical protein VGL56_04785 [Fimbriimonadaceae bacterium]